MRRSTASDAASALMPLRPKVPSPPASDTAATSSGVVGPPAMPASSTGWRMPSSAQSRFAKGGSVSAARHPRPQISSTTPPDTERGNKPGLTGSFPLRKGYKMRRHLLALYVAGAAVATLVAANSAVAATWTRR